MSLALALPEPAQVERVDLFCSQIDAWSQTCDDVAELADAKNKVSALDHYLALNATDGRAQLAATMRRLEVRIGELLGPAPTPQETGALKGSIANEPSPLSKDERHQFRQMAEHPEVVDDVIETSTDDEPASRRKVLDEIKRRTQPEPDTTPDRPLDPRQERAASRRETVAAMHAAGYASQIIADRLGVAVGTIQADKLSLGLVGAGGGRQRANPDQVVADIAEKASAIAMVLESLNTDHLAPTPDEASRWLDDLSGCRTALGSLIATIRKANQ